MTGYSAATGSRRRALRLVVLALTLAGFVAMHGLAPAAPGAAHCGSPAALLLAGGAHPADAHPPGAHPPVGHPADQPAAHRDRPVVGVPGTGVGAPEPARPSDELVVGCLLALLTTLVALGMRLVGSRGVAVVAASARQAPSRSRSARAPPDPLFLSLCVLRR
jgi:hypothetical protein